MCLHSASTACTQKLMFVLQNYYYITCTDQPHSEEGVLDKESAMVCFSLNIKTQLIYIHFRSLHFLREMRWNKLRRRNTLCIVSYIPMNQNVTYVKHLRLVTFSHTSSI